MMEKGGLIDQIAYFIVISGGIQLLWKVVNPFNIQRKLNNWLFFRQFSQRDTFYEFQNTLNSRLLYNKFDLALIEAEYIVQLYTASFYAYLLPIGDLFTGLLLIGHFWSDKIILLTCSSYNHEYSYDLTRTLLILSQSSILIYAAGVLIFSNYTMEIYPLSSVGFFIALGYVLFYVFVSTQLKSDLLMSSEKTSEPRSYNQVWGKLK